MDANEGSIPRSTVSLTVIPRDDAEESRSLHAWLTREDALRGRVEQRHLPASDGDMGGLLDCLVVTLGSGGVGALLAQSVLTWLGQRRADVSVTIRTADGREVTIDLKGTKDPMAVVREVERLTTPPRG